MSMSMSTSIRFPPCQLLCPRSRAARCKRGMENRLDSLQTVSAVKQQERRDRQRQVAGEFDAKTNHSDNNNNNSNSAMPYTYIYIYLDKDKKKTKTKKQNDNKRRMMRKTSNVVKMLRACWQKKKTQGIVRKRERY